MDTCQGCVNLFPVPEAEEDFQPGKADCVLQKEDEKGKYWLSKPIFENSERCSLYHKS